jgi:hypothetical protein
MHGVTNATGRDPELAVAANTAATARHGCKARSGLYLCLAYPRPRQLYLKCVFVFVLARLVLSGGDAT